MAADPDVLEQALAQVELGFAAFALQANGKRPATQNGFKNATRNGQWLATQLQAPSAGNYGITWPADAPETVLALDLDNGADGREEPWQKRLTDLIARIGPLPSTKHTVTPSGGRHAFYRWPAHVPVPPGDEMFGFTVRWPGRGYLVGPGSSIDGILYMPGPTPEIAELPEAWVDAVLAGHRRSPDDFVTIAGSFELPARIPAGRRYATVRDYIASRYNAGLTPDELWDLVRLQVAPRFDSPKPEHELRGDFERAMAKIVERLGPPRRTGQAAAPTIPAGPLEDAPLTEFVSTPIDWLWPRWLPRGVVTLMDGNPGVSKSTLVADLVARITTGRSWPDEQPGSGGARRVMWITTEDDPGRVLRPRIEAADGNAGLVRFVTSEVVFPSGAGAFRELVVQRASEPEGLGLVVLDPLFSHIEASVKTIADAEMRKGVMNPLQDAADAAAVAILVVRHFNKDATASALTRGAGSLGGIVGAARALWSVTVDKEDESGETKAVGVAKLNYAQPGRPLRYKVVSRVPPGWLTGTVSGIEWLGEAPMSIDELLNEDSSTPSAVEALQAILANGAVDADTVHGMMRSRGYGRQATSSAARRLEVVKSKSGFRAGWTWRLPHEDADDAGADSSDSSSSRARAREDTAPSDSSASSGVGQVGHEESEESEDVEESEASRARPDARPREAAPTLTVVERDVDPSWLSGGECSDYQRHTASHRWAGSGWTCDACHPPEVLA